MAESRNSALRELSESELAEQIDAARKALFELRCQRATRQLEKSHLFRRTRTNLARLLTVQRQRKQQQRAAKT